MWKIAPHKILYSNNNCNNNKKNNNNGYNTVKEMNTRPKLVMDIVIRVWRIEEDDINNYRL